MEPSSNWKASPEWCNLLNLLDDEKVKAFPLKTGGVEKQATKMLVGTTIYDMIYWTMWHMRCDNLRLWHI